MGPACSRTATPLTASAHQQVGFHHKPDVAILAQNVQSLLLTLVLAERLNITAPAAKLHVQMPAYFDRGGCDMKFQLHLMAEEDVVGF